jgi:hypothetical protein
MSKEINLDKVQSAALNRIERSQKHYKMAITGAALVEALFFIAFVFLMDFANRTHVLMLVATMATYTIVGVGLVALGTHTNNNTQILLRAIEMLEKSLEKPDETAK